VKTLRARGGKDAKTGYDLTGDYFGLPWPCYGTAAIKHPGSPNLYDTSKHVMDGGGCFRANFGVERDGVNLLAEDGVYSKGSEITTGYPEFDHVLLKKLGWWDDLTEAEKKEAEGKNWKTDLSGGIQRVAMKHGCHPFGNAKARAVVWNFPDGVPLHREPLFTPKAELIDKWPTHDDVKVLWRLPTLFKTVQQKNRDAGKQFPLILTSGRLVEYEGGGDETRSNPWLAELQQDNFVEINPKAAADRGIRNTAYGCVTACKQENEVPWGVNRRRVVTINDGIVGAEKSISVACMHCSDAPCMAVCPVDCFYKTEDGVVLHDKDLCIGCGYCFYACPF